MEKIIETECVCVNNWVTFLYSRDRHNTVKQLYFNKKKRKKFIVLTFHRFITPQLILIPTSLLPNFTLWAFLTAQTFKNPPTMQETQVRSLSQEDSPGEGNGYPLQYSCLDNSMDRGAWQFRGERLYAY